VNVKSLSARKKEPVQEAQHRFTAIDQGAREISLKFHVRPTRI
jgi:hypothetical protein